MSRTVLYLVAVLPVTYVVAFVSAIPAAISLPPDVLQQSILTVPIFVVVGGWIGGKLIPTALVPADQRTAAHTKNATMFTVALHTLAVVLLLLATLTGLATAREAVVLAAIVILAAHTVALNWLRAGG